MRYEGEANYVMDDLSLAPIGTQREQVVANLSIRMLSEVAMTYPDGSKYPLQVGQLALGASGQNQTFDIGNGEPSINVGDNYFQTH